jgi:hypothetical protein
VLMDGKTNHLFKPVMIGRISDDGRILPVSVTEGLVPPEPWSPWLGNSRLGASQLGSSRFANTGSVLHARAAAE